MKLTLFRTFVGVVSLYGLIDLCSTAGYNEVCSEDTDCKDANTFCEASVSDTCKKGKCKCLRHMVWDEKDSKCKVKKYNVDKCNMTVTSCQGGAECMADTGQCKCKGDTNRFYPSLRKCIDSPSPLKVIGEECSDDDDCYMEISNAVECVVPSGSTDSKKKCACASGYIENMSSCRKPFLDELCSASVGCAMEIALSEGSFVNETCSSNTPSRCTCPNSSSIRTIVQDGRSAKICMKHSTIELLPEGKQCLLHKHCETSYCLMCPGELKKKCVAAPN